MKTVLYNPKETNVIDLIIDKTDELIDLGDDDRTDVFIVTGIGGIELLHNQLLTHESAVLTTDMLGPWLEQDKTTLRVEHNPQLDNIRYSTMYPSTHYAENSFIMYIFIVGQLLFVLKPESTYGN